MTSPQEPATPAPPGLSSAEAAARLERFGPNAVVEEARHPLRQLAGRFWAPVPWLLEATIIVQLFLGERIEALVIGGLLVLNAAASLVQEGRASKALALLRQKLQVEARVRRDGIWVSLPAERLVPGDFIHLSPGTITPADVRLAEGALEVDQSALTGESASVPVAPGKFAYAGSMVRSGEAAGEVTATGAATFFGKTAELVRTARSANRQEHEIVAVVRNLFVANVALMVVTAGYAEAAGTPFGRILPLLMSIALASIPVALPATFTLAAALGSVELTRRGILITRLSALHDLASMTVLCSDKTGTLTRNEAMVKGVWAATGFSQIEVLRAAALASDPSGQDPVDRAVLEAASRHGHPGEGPPRIDFQPFDPQAKRAVASYREEGGIRRYAKGAPSAIAGLGGEEDPAWRGAAEALEGSGQRVLGVAMGDGERWTFAGLVGLEDAIRDDSKAVLESLAGAGVRTVMVTGDNAVTAASVARQVGIAGSVCPPERLHEEISRGEMNFGVFARVLPEDKIGLVRALQRRGAVVGMSGDGVNDAPALRQAEVGVAVANATDVAKAAAALVLTEPGLGGIVPAIDAGRRVFQRTLTYTVAMLTKKFEMMVLLVAGFLLTGIAPLRPLLMVYILILNDLLTMSIAADSMSISARPNRWKTRGIVLVSSVLAACKLVFSLGVFLAGFYLLRMPAGALQTLTFAVLIVSSQAGVYLFRERGHFWGSRPSLLLLAGSLGGLAAAAFIAIDGILTPAVPIGTLLAASLAGLAIFVAVDWIKIRLFARFDLR